MTSLVLNEEALCDALVHDDDRDDWLLLGSVVGLSDGLTELVHLLLKDLLPHAIANTVTVDDEVLRVITMLLLEAAECTLDGILQLLVDDFLPFLLDDAL